MKKIAIALVVIIAVVAISWYAREKFVGSAPKIDPRKQAQEAERAAAGKVLDELQKTDQDLDGLTDAEEGQYGTDPNMPDTDSDGLFDRDEVKVYKTAPNKADTDGDGINDGVEVSRGTNPLSKTSK